MFKETFSWGFFMFGNSEKRVENWCAVEHLWQIQCKVTGNLIKYCKKSNRYLYIKISKPQFIQTICNTKTLNLGHWVFLHSPF